ncbi:hypothetical protein FM042_08010 [Aliidiomarina halalkaliphila]|uniref:Transcriptional regulator n=1 Tax=Aliidiomarina halalkaliphila TaxID=2593535 RepID=A0A552X1L1_9GAMM|nr:type IV toxin-antitoxin system AbiEi family antitoxin domain-containing protein [Aliidiomarina halalkaliphila]TRW48917.1 hypothetical protein FM042_08010 [Aliidiomarina halalkaliphila]
MKADNLIEVMHMRRKDGGPRVASAADIHAFFPDEKRENINTSLLRLHRRGKIARVCRGIYALKEDYEKFPFLLEHTAEALRRGHYVYLSQETFLSERSIISQQAFVVTLMTTGASGKVRTPLGQIEFTSTKLKLMGDIDKYLFSKERRLYVPPVSIAYADLKRAGRNLDLVDPEMLAEALKEEEQPGSCSWWEEDR